MTAEAVKEARDHLGVTQQELADLLGRSRQTISGWEQRGCDRTSGLALAALLLIRGHRETAEAFIWKQTSFPGFKNGDRKATA